MGDYATELAALKTAYARGVTEVSYSGLTTKYDSQKAMLARIREVEAWENKSVGNSVPMVGYAGFKRDV